jgi:hypothetical protein
MTIIQKFEFLSKYKPLYFFATAPGKEISFKVATLDGQIMIEEESQQLVYRNHVLAELT